MGRRGRGALRAHLRGRAPWPSARRAAYAAVAARPPWPRRDADELERELPTSLERAANLPRPRGRDAAGRCSRGERGLAAGDRSPRVARAPTRPSSTRSTAGCSAREPERRGARADARASRGRARTAASWCARSAGPPRPWPAAWIRAWLGDAARARGWTEERACEAAFRQPIGRALRAGHRRPARRRPRDTRGGARAGARRARARVDAARTRSPRSWPPVGRSAMRRTSPAGRRCSMHLAAQSTQSARLQSPSRNAKLQELPVIDKVRSRARRIRDAAAGHP